MNTFYTYLELNRNDFADYKNDILKSTYSGKEMIEDGHKYFNTGMRDLVTYMKLSDGKVFDILGYKD